MILFRETVTNSKSLNFSVKNTKVEVKNFNDVVKNIIVEVKNGGDTDSQLNSAFPPF